MLNFENLHLKSSATDKDQIRKLWLEEGVLENNVMVNARLEQVVYVVRDDQSGLIIGLTTAKKATIKHLNNNKLYEFRCFISKSYRIAGLDVKISKLTLEYLEKYSQADEVRPIGVYSIVENQVLQKESAWRRAVWPELNMYLIGYTNSGQHIRVCYFKNARI